MNDLNEYLLNQYNDLFINKNVAVINKLSLGFIDEDCSIPILGILIHCLENTIIFNNTQKNNLINLLNKVNYA